MRTPRLLVPALLALGAIAYVGVPSVASAPPWTLERYYTNETWHAFADIGTKSAGPDDVYAAQQSLKTLDGHEAGVVNGYGVNLRRPYVYFHWTATLDGGTLTLESAVDLKSTTTTYPITGGTGRYDGVRGSVTLTDAGSNGTLATVRYRS
jgi:hypothetical protein